MSQQYIIIEQFCLYFILVDKMFSGLDGFQSDSRSEFLVCFFFYSAPDYVCSRGAYKRDVIYDGYYVKPA